MNIFTFILYIFMGLVVPAFGREAIEFVPGRCYVFEPGFLKDDSSKSFSELTVLEQLARRCDERGIDVFLAKPEKGALCPVETKRVVFFNSPNEKAFSYLMSLPKEKRVLLVWEPPSVDRTIHERQFHALFSRVLTWDDSLAGHTQYMTFCHPVLKPVVSEVPRYGEKKLCCSVSANKTSTYPGELYSERLAAILFFEKNRAEFDMYGVGWKEDEFAQYKGPVDDKIECMKQYRFSICYENTGDKNGYITEKLFDSFSAGCVPVYLGAPNITDYVPKECFVDKRDFASYEDLYAFLRKMPEETYNGYIASIKEFLSSSGGKRFSMERVVDELITGMLAHTSHTHEQDHPHPSDHLSDLTHRQYLADISSSRCQKSDQTGCGHLAHEREKCGLDE